jgi:phosphoribosylformimino-5-aminoimidazole carboxamide ribotide isomerase
MLIPSIDLMQGKIVQLVQGEKKALEFDSFEPWIVKFSKFPIVQLIDLDAAKDEGDNARLVKAFCQRLPCQVGGGVRTVARGQELLQWGARAVIVGSSLVSQGAPDLVFARSLASQVKTSQLIFAVDSRAGKVVVAGWRESTPLAAAEMMSALDPYCSAFLYTNVETEGLMQGFPVDLIPELQRATKRRLIVAGGIRNMNEVQQLDQLGVDAVVGMAIYTGAMGDFDREVGPPGFEPGTKGL